ncbi:hypothetical protein [Solibacillus merdavium]|uniref:Uncharacterized protein n=1 Tax=Solibacillus merdavium TaxID=2762218 RepID=A0ABR8XM69_9BACL|nr:hypothetical protein [Solibacillus merdavium]MBD8033029.1 hypothetical protein [Solibacillus merdavium]
MKKGLILTLVFTMAFFNFFQFNNAVVKAESLVENDIHLDTQFLDGYVENNVEYNISGNLETYKLTLNGVVYEVSYNTETETFLPKASDLDSGEELNIEQLKEQQIQNGEVVSGNSNSSEISLMIALPLVPIATWAFEHLIAMIIAASLISIVVVAKDEVKSELISRFKDKNPTFIYRTGSGNGTNMTPRVTDLDGLSYTLTMPSKSFTATTMEAVNKTKVLKAIKDKPGHVAVYPTNKSELKSWAATRENALNKPHKYTKMMQGISVKVK